MKGTANSAFIPITEKPLPCFSVQQKGCMGTSRAIPQGPKSMGLTGTLTRRMEAQGSWERWLPCLPRAGKKLQSHIAQRFLFRDLCLSAASILNMILDSIKIFIKT